MKVVDIYINCIGYLVNCSQGPRFMKIEDILEIPTVYGFMIVVGINLNYHSGDLL